MSESLPNQPEAAQKISMGAPPQPVKPLSVLAAEIEAVWLKLLKMIGRKYGVDALHEMMADVDSEEVFEKYEQVVRDAEETSFNGDRTNNAAECE